MNKNRREFLDDVFDAFTMLSGGNYVSLYDVKGHVTRYSPGAVELFDLPGEYISDGEYDWVNCVHPEDRKRYQGVMENLVVCKTLTYDLTYRVRTRDGNYALFRFVGAVLRDDKGNPSLIGGMCINEGLMENTDPVTVLRNQYGFFNDLSAMMKINQKCVILLIGISRMSRINAEHGYGYGNRLLQQMGWIIQENIGQDGIIYRMEGSKFAFMTKTLSEREVAAVYKKISRKLQSGIFIDGVRQNLIANGGLIAVNDFTLNDRAIFTCLEYAYKESKDRKHGTLVVFGEKENKNSRESLELIDTIRTCMIDECQGFYLSYQPVFDIRTEKIMGVEALIRWRDEEYGEVLPTVFMPVLEQDFAFEELGIWIMRQAMINGKKFLKRDPQFIVGINISPSQLENDFFLESLLEVAEQTEFPLANLCLELTKDCRLMDLELLTEKVADFQDRGIQILIDDFGSGFSSLEILKALSADFIKFDMQFVDKIEFDEKDRQDLQHLAAMASVHGTNVCVKGVKTNGMRDILKTFPISSVQGTLYAEAESADEIIEMYLA